MIVNAHIEELVALWEPRLRDAFLESVALVRDRAVLTAIIAALVRGDVDAAVRAVDLDPVSFRPLDAAISQAFEQGGSEVAAAIPPARDAIGHRLKIMFDARNPRAETWLRTHSSALVREVVEDQLTAIRQHLVTGMAAGQNPRTVALDLVGRVDPVTKRREGGVIGLTSTQEIWVRNYAADLASGGSAALTRNLRDPRFDVLVRKAVAEGRPIPKAVQAKMVAAYRNRALRYRATAIARTEAMAALHESSIHGTEQAIERGQVRAEHVTKEWRDSRDTRTRDTHVHLNGQKVGFRDRFTSRSGAKLRYPCDPEAPIEERVQCRCNMLIRVNFLAEALS